MFSVLEIRGADLDKEQDGKDHVDHGENHVVDDGLHLRLRGVFIFENSTSGKITAAEVLGPCYIEDDQTVTKTATSASVAGLVIRVDDEGVAVEMGFGYTPATAGAGA